MEATRVGPARNGIAQRIADGGGDILRWGVFAVSSVLFVWGLAGIIANPDFATGSGATSVQVLGVDMNGWHGLSGVLLAGPGLIAARRAELSLLFIPAAVASLVITAIWALFSDRPAGLFPFDHPTSDVILHLAMATAYLVVLGAAYRASQRTQA